MYLEYFVFLFVTCLLGVSHALASSSRAAKSYSLDCWSNTLWNLGTFVLSGVWKIIVDDVHDCPVKE